jgi:hypothetical protein
MKRFLAAFLLLPVLQFAQNSSNYWEIGGYVGGLNYTGEITEEGDVGTWINEMRPEFGVFLKKNFNYRVNLGVEASYGNLYAADANRGNEDRDYIMNTEIVQTNLFTEINFKKFGKYFQRNQNSPYIKLGGGVLLYTPTLNTNASYPDDYELYRGSFSTYNLNAAFGWKWRIAYHSILSLDFHVHTTGTNYLEGFAKKDGPQPNDGYYGLRLSYSYGIF